MEFLQGIITTLIGTGTPFGISLGLLGLVGWGIARMPKSSDAEILKLSLTVDGLRGDFSTIRKDVTTHDLKQDLMHGELRASAVEVKHSVDALSDKVGLLAERVARHDGLLERKGL